MEQWISDSFYSYFPSLNDEKNKEREQINRLQRLEYQNYIKKVANDKNTSKHNENHNSIPTTSRSDNTEMEIIVNNPNYETPKSTETTRPGSTRHKLLQDLRHTGLAKMMFDDAIQNRNQENIDNENRKKKEYQKELMRQIEEKRKQIEILKLSEKTAEEAMTKKLEEQLKTERIRFELEQNKIIHHRLLEKLKNDLEDSVQSVSSIESNPITEKINDSPKDQSNQNEVYKFFKNSGTTFRKINHQLSLADTSLNDSDKKKQPINPQIPKETCFHIDQRVCPYCNVKYLFCKNCNDEFFKNEYDNCRLFCKKCESKYFMCLVCDKEKECCSFCQRKRNICTQCILNYCINCGNTMNNRKTLEDISERNVNIDNGINNKNGYQSFRILDDNDTNNEDIENDDKYFETHRNPFPININRSSLFHPDYNLDDIDNFDTLRNITNEKLSKYIKNYGDLTNKKIAKDKIEKPYNFQPQQNYKQKRNNKITDEFSNRYELPKETRSNLPTNPFVITQLGAMRRQLKLNQLKTDNVIK